MAVGCPFVGREDVLAELREALERASAGRGGLVTLTGAAGAGKTRTAEEATARSGLRALWTWCPPGTAGRAFRPWSRLLRELAADDATGGRLVAASPPLRALVSGAAATGPPAGGGTDPETSRLRLSGDVAELLVSAARRAPLLLVLDDLHAADASSLRLLLELADTARTAPLLLLATARDDDTAWHDRAWARAQLFRRGRTLPLGPLRAPDVATLVETATGTPPTAEAVRAVLHRTGGEPFFVTELLRDAAVPAASAELTEGAVPSVTVRAAVAARLSELGPRTVRLLDVAAVLGTRFRIDVLGEAAGVPLAEVRGLLGEADAAGLLGEIAPDRAAFRHDLLREAVHGALTPAERAALHHAVAEVLAGHARRGRDAGPAEVAHHLLLAGPEHTRQAAAYAHDAAIRAERLYAFEDAARWYERAAEAYERAGPTGGHGATGLTETHSGGMGSAAAHAGTRTAEPHGTTEPAEAPDDTPRPEPGDVGVLGEAPADTEATEAAEADDGAYGAYGARGQGGEVPGESGRGGSAGAGCRTEAVVLCGGTRVPESEGSAGVRDGGGLGGEPGGSGRGGSAGTRRRAEGDGLRDGRAASAEAGDGVPGRRAGSPVAYPLTGRDDAPVGSQLVEVLLGLGAARLGAGERAIARGVFLRAARLARGLRRPDLLARAALGLGTGPVGFEVDLSDREQLDLLTEARAALAATHPALRARVTARLSLAAALVESEERRVGLAEEAVRVAREAGDSSALGTALAALCDARSGPEHCRDRLGWAGEIIGIGRALSEPVLELLGRRLRLVALLETGDFVAADAEALAYETAVRPLRRPLYAWYVPLWRGSRALREGRYDDCAAALDETEELGRAADSPNAALLAGTQRWCLYAWTGDLDSMTRLLATLPALERLPGLWPRVTLALLAAQYGRLDEAALGLSAVAPRLAVEPRDSEWLPMVAQAAETVGALGAHPTAPLLYDLLAPYAGLFAVEGIGAAVRGPVDRHLALLAAAMADPERARAHRERALRAARETGSAALAARIEIETGTEAGTETETETETGSTGAGVGPARRPTRSAAVAVPVSVAESVFRRDGHLWHLGYAGREVRLADSKGLHDIAVLLARPGTPVPAVELAAVPVPAPAGTAPAEGLHPEGDTGEVVDATARAAYRRRLRELESEAEEADATGDAPRSERIAAERDALVGQLSEAYGIGGRVRRTGSPAERARTAVTARIRAAVHRIDDVHPELGRHLRAALRTGTLCVYQPERPPDWRL